MCERRHLSLKISQAWWINWGGSRPCVLYVNNPSFAVGKSHSGVVSARRIAKAVGDFPNDSTENINNRWQIMSAGVGVCIQHECYPQLQWLHMHIKLQCEVSPFSAAPKSIFTLTILLLTPQRAQQMPHNQPTTFIPALNQVKPINWAALWSEPLSKQHTEPVSLKKRKEHE